MKEAPAIFVAVLCSVSQPARAETWVVSDADSKQLCQSLQAELEQIGIDATASRIAGNPRRARRRAFANQTVDALASCQSGPSRIEVFYPDGSRLGTAAFAVSANDAAAMTTVYVSERIRSERFVADVPLPVPFAPAVWWLGVGADAVFSPGGIAPLAFVTLDVGYRFHRHWSLGGFVSIQPYMRRLDSGPLETRMRLDQLGVAIAYHPLVAERVDLAIGVRAAAARLGVNGTLTAADATLQGQRDGVWLAFPAGRVSLRVELARRLWLRFRGELGALLPRAVVSAGQTELASLGVFAGQAGLALEVHFR
ncbi:MAG: hypothetical protein WCB63_10710 [Polyangiales bacterium]|jgi:hypothetical protein